MSLQAPQPNIFPGGSVGTLSVRFWLLVLLTGVGAGLGAGALMLLLHATQNFFWSYSSGSFLAGVQRRGAAWRTAVLVLAGLVAGLYRWLLRLNPGGHGGEVNEAIWFRSGRVPALRTIIRAAMSIVLVGMGASLGREAAPKQTGAAIASKLASWGKLSPAERRLLAACGVGAGMGAVYNVPFGGALFTLEVLLGTLALPLVPPALATSLIATGISWLILPDLPTYHIPVYHTSAAAAVWAIWAGPLAGFAAVLYVRAIAWADARKPQGWRRLVIPVVVFAVLGGLAIPFPQLLGNGKDVVQKTFVGGVGLPIMLALVFLKPAATAGCLGSGAPGGLFTPTMTYGALLGGILGRLWAMLWPGMPVGGYAVLGAAAVLAASMQGPVSTFVLIFELTHHLDLILPMMLAIAGAVAVARRLEQRSIYSARIHIGRKAAGARAPARATAFDDLLVRAFAPISAATPYPEILLELVKCGKCACPLHVVDEEGRLVGAIAPERVSGPGRENPLLETATAADLVDPVQSVPSSAARQEVLRRLAAAGGPVPVVDAETGLLVGLARSPDGRGR
jgi:CIC family chloride channel protein